MTEATPTPLCLEGIRVLDLTWALAGPAASRILADHGAEVLKLESERSMDPSRVGGPWLHGINTSPDGGGSFALLNRNKRSATLNLKSARGKELFKQLVAISDVVVNNYSAGVMKRFGLGYEELRRINPRIVMAELSGFGQTGPYSGYVAYGQSVMALAGAYELTGYPDQAPVMPAYTYADFASPTIGAFAIMAALIWRQTSNVGQYIDVSQLQVAASLVSESQFAALVNGDNPTRAGNAEPGTLVHDCYRCLGEDQWCVIVVRSDEEWSRLREIIGPALPVEAFGRDTIAVDRAIESWTELRNAAEVMETLQGVGIEAARVQSVRETVDDDAHLAARGYYETYDHLLGEKAMMDGVPFKMSETPAHVRRPGPVYGSDNDYVFGELLGLSDDEILALRESGVIH